MLELNTENLDKAMKYMLLIKEYTEFVEEIKEVIREKGSFCIDTHVCTVQDRMRETLGPLKELEKMIDRKVLEDWGMIRKTPFKVVTITRSGQKEEPEPAEWMKW